MPLLMTVPGIGALSSLVYVGTDHPDLGVTVYFAQSRAAGFAIADARQDELQQPGRRPGLGALARHEGGGFIIMNRAVVLNRPLLSV